MTWLEFFSSLAASTAWPIAVAVVMFIFRSQLLDLLPKIENISAAGVSIGMKKGRSSPHYEDLPLKESLEKLSPNALRSSHLGEIESSLQKDLAHVSEDQRESLLLTSLAQTRLESAFNLAYANIFGSQIRALRLLNDRGGRISREAAEAEFKNLQHEHPIFSDWSLDQYMKFLRHYLFIDEVQGEFILTDFGRDFLAHLVRKGLSEDRLH